MQDWYRECRAGPDLGEHVRCTWAADVGGPPRSLVPDGCVDLLWIDRGSLVVCGPETSGWSFALPAGTTAVGIRFLPGVAPVVLGFDASEVRNARVGVDDLWGSGPARRLDERLGLAVSPAARVRVLEDLARRCVAEAPDVDPLVRDVADRAERPAPLSVRDLAADLRISERQLLRRCTAAFGYGPTVLARILRLQRFLAAARVADARRPLAQLAHVAGYADQPHLSREVRALAGTTPSALLAA